MRAVDLNKKQQQPATVQDADLTAQTVGNGDTPPAFSFTPSTQNDTSAPDTADTKPEASDYSYFSDLTKRYTEPPMTRKEVERRSRGAAASQAMAGLGNTISAFSNLAFAGTAPTQTIPQLPDVNYQRLEDKAREQRQQYNEMQYRGKAADYNAYRQALSQWYARRAQKAELERKRLNDTIGNMKWQYEKNYQAGRDKEKDAQADRNYRLRQQELADNGNYRKKRLEIEKYKTDNSGKKKRQVYPTLHIEGSRGRSRDYDMNKDSDILQLWGEYKKTNMYKGLEGNEPDTPEKIRNYLMTRLGVKEQETRTDLLPDNDSAKGKENNDKLDW